MKAWRIFFILCLLLWSIAGLFAKPVHSYPPNSNSTKVSGYGPVPGYNVPVLTANNRLGEVTLWRSKRIDPTGFYWLGARYYDSVGGRFLSPDPAGFAGSTWDRYSFANNDPINQFDPDGRLGKGITDLGNRQLGFRRDQDDWAYRNSAAGQYMAAYQQTQRQMQAAWQYGIDNDSPYAAADRREGALISAVNVATLGLANDATVLATGRDMSGDLVTSQEKWLAGVNVGSAVAPGFLKAGSMAGRSFGAMRGLGVAKEAPRLYYYGPQEFVDNKLAKGMFAGGPGAQGRFWATTDANAEGSA